MHKGAYWHAKIFLQGQKSHTCQQCRYHRILGKTPIIKMTFLWSPFLTLSLLWMSFFDLTLPPLLYPSIPLTAVFSLSHHHLSLGLCHSREKLKHANLCPSMKKQQLHWICLLTGTALQVVVLTIWSCRGWGCSTFNLCTTTFNHKPVIQVLRWESASFKISSVGLGLNAINFRQIIEGLLITAIKFIKLSRLPTHCNQTHQCQDTKTPPNVWRLQPEVQHPEALQVTERLVTLVN